MRKLKQAIDFDSMTLPAGGAYVRSRRLSQAEGDDVFFWVGVDPYVPPSSPETNDGDDGSGGGGGGGDDGGGGGGADDDGGGDGGGGDGGGGDVGV